jgi:hypothetical protein
MTTTPTEVTDRAALPATGSVPGWLAETEQAIQELLRLPPNWNSYGAQPIRPDVVRAAKDLLPGIVQKQTPQPNVVPTVRGGVQLEWHLGDIDLEIEIDAPGQFQVLFVDPRENLELEIELDSTHIPQMYDLCARLLSSHE